MNSGGGAPRLSLPLRLTEMWCSQSISVATYSMLSWPYIRSYRRNKVTIALSVIIILCVASLVYVGPPRATSFLNRVTTCRCHCSCLRLVPIRISLHIVFTLLELPINTSWGGFMLTSLPPGPSPWPLTLTDLASLDVLLLSLPQGHHIINLISRYIFSFLLRLQQRKFSSLIK